MYNPNHNYTDEELIRTVFTSATASQLELELAQRLELAKVKLDDLDHVSTQAPTSNLVRRVSRGGI